METSKIIAAANIVLAIGGGNGFVSTEVQNSTFGSRINVCAEIPPIANTRPVSGQHKKDPALKFNNVKSMKTKFITLFFVLFATVSFAQSTSEAPTQNISPDSNAVYRLFATRNKFTFIKLNTRNGQMSHIQWGTGKNDRKL